MSLSRVQAARCPWSPLRGSKRSYSALALLVQGPEEAGHWPLSSKVSPATSQPGNPSAGVAFSRHARSRSAPSSLGDRWVEHLSEGQENSSRTDCPAPSCPRRREVGTKKGERGRYRKVGSRETHNPSTSLWALSTFQESHPDHSLAPNCFLRVHGQE